MNNLALDNNACPSGSTWLRDKDVDSSVDAAHDLSILENQEKIGGIQYAMDMTDELALTKSDVYDANDPKKREHVKTFGDKKVGIYTIAYGNIPITTDNGIGENLLRYMASVGDDGDRTTDPCFDHNDLISGVRVYKATGVSCGNYYHATSAADLLNIFEDIGKRIQTKISY
jgi:hypothetical protein